MRKTTLRQIARVLAVLILAVGALYADPVVFYGFDPNPGGSVPPAGNAAIARSQFLANLINVGNETFESIAAGTVPPLALSFPGSSGGITATLNASGSAQGGVCDTSSGTVGNIGCNGFGRFPTSGTHWFHTSSDSFSVTFSQAIAAFGFYGTDIGDFDGQVTATLVGGTTVDLTIPVQPNSPDGSLIFWGFVDPIHSYTAVNFGNTQAGTDVFGFDDLVIGDHGQVTMTPEPGAWLLLLTVGLGLGGRLWKRHTA